MEARVAPRALARALLAAALPSALGLALGGCYIDTQRHPAPMRSAVDPLPPGTTERYPAGPEEVLVVRISDPVYVRRPGEASSYPLYFYRKQARLNAGSWVFSGAGGRVEILFGDNSSIMLFGLGSGVVGSASRQEPLFDLHQVARARIAMTSPQQVRLLGGAILETDTGPFVVERAEDGILRVRNRSTGEGRIAYREEIILLDPGQVVDLPVLDTGTAPSEVDPDLQRLASTTVPVEVRGAVEQLAQDDGLRLRAAGDNEIRAHGLRVRLDPGDEVLFAELGAERSAPAEPPAEVPRAAAEGTRPAEGR